MRNLGLFKKAYRSAAIVTMGLVLAVGGVLYHQPVPAHGATNGLIAFSRLAGSVYQIHTMNADGTNLQQLTTPDDSFSPSWSPDGTKLAYSTYAGSTTYQIAVMNADGTGQTQLTTGSSNLFWPSWSPDGSKLVFLCNDGTDDQLCTMNADGTNQTQITNDANGHSAPDWSVTGKIAYTCYDGARNQICTSNPDGTGAVQLTNDAKDHDLASWSNDGSKILYQETGTLYVSRLAIINADGTGLQHVTTTATDVQSPHWSPDNSKIVYSNYVSGTDTDRRIYTINVDGSNEAAVSPNDGNYSDTPSWQPLVTSDQDGDGSTTVIEKAGPNGGDANNDGVGDFVQSNVTSFVNGVTNQYAILQSTCTSNSGVSIAAADHADSGFVYPAGLVSFTLHCGTAGTAATVTQYFYGLNADSTFVLRKYNPVSHQYQTIPGATISAATIGGKTATKVTYQVTDGGPFDQDGTPNGVIVDPTGVAQPSAIAPNTGLGGTAL